MINLKDKEIIEMIAFLEFTANSLDTGSDVAPNIRQMIDNFRKIKIMLENYFYGEADAKTKN